MTGRPCRGATIRAANRTASTCGGTAATRPTSPRSTTPRWTVCWTPAGPKPDPAKKKAIYEDVNREFGKQAFNLWLNWTQWDIATATNVHGILGPDLPDNGGKPFPGLAVGHSVAGLWVSK